MDEPVILDNDRIPTRQEIENLLALAESVRRGGAMSETKLPYKLRSFSGRDGELFWEVTDAAGGTVVTWLAASTLERVTVPDDIKNLVALNGLDCASEPVDYGVTGLWLAVYIPSVELPIGMVRISDQPYAVIQRQLEELIEDSNMKRRYG